MNKIDESDIAKINEVKTKLVKLQLYEEAASLRSFENVLRGHIHEQALREKRKEQADYGIDFATYILKFFIPIQGDIDGVKYLAYRRVDDVNEKPKGYTPADVHDFFIEYKTAQQFEEKTGWTLINTTCDRPNPAAGMV